MDDELDIIVDDIEESEEELFAWNWPQFTVWYLKQYPDDCGVIERIDESYRFELNENEQNALLSIWGLGVSIEF